MAPFDQGELVRSPLDSTILSLRDMLNEPVTPILLECLEPPNISTIERSFQSLHQFNFISHPSDEGVITSMGGFVVKLGIDLTLGNFVGLGIQFGVAAEAIQLAAVLSFPQSPWAISRPMYHDDKTFNEITSKTFTSRCLFDAGLFSEPMAVINLLHDYSHCKDRIKFCWKHCLSSSRMRHMFGTVQNLQKRVSEHLEIDPKALEIEHPLNHSKVNILRILQVWIFYETIIVQSPSKRLTESVNGFEINLVGPPIGRQHLSQILDDRHKFEILSKGQINAQGRFGSMFSDLSEKEFELRFASYALEKKIDMSSYFWNNMHKFFVPEHLWKIPLSEVRESEMGNIKLLKVDQFCLQPVSGGNKRGIRGRASGAWHLSNASDTPSANKDDTIQMKRVIILTFYLANSKGRKAVEKFVEKNYLVNVTSSIFCSINETKSMTSFSLTMGGECYDVSKTDLCDMFAAPDLVARTTGSIQQSINFPFTENGLSHIHPLIKDAPEGARLMTAIASARRKENFIRFNDGKDADGTSDKIIDVVLPKNLSINGKKWKRKDGRGMVYVQENCVPAAALPVNHDLELFGCCANTLELRGGACRVEGISLLPQGRLFLGLALLAFGVNPRTGSSQILNVAASNFEEMEEIANEIVEDAWSWIKEVDNGQLENSYGWRVIEALRFHAGCLQLGETLDCQPDKIKALCAIFDMVDGHPMTVWNVETVASLRTKSSARKTNRDFPHSVQERVIVPSELISSKKKRTPKPSVAATASRNPNNWRKNTK